MGLLQIVTGYVSDNYRKEVPAILYVGYDGGKAREVAGAAPAEFHRIELIKTRGGHRLRKVAPSVALGPVPGESEVPADDLGGSQPEVPPADPSPDPEPEAPAEKSADAPAEDSDDAPSLLPRSPRNRK